MNFDQAEKVRLYRDIPRLRTDQVRLIVDAGYTQLNGRRLSECLFTNRDIQYNPEDVDTEALEARLLD